MHRTFLCIASAMLFTAAFSQARSAGATEGATVLIKDGRATLRQIEAKAADAASEAGKLEQASRAASLSWQTHSDFLGEISEDINRMGKEIDHLEFEQESLAPWEREALVKAAPLLKDAASNTDQAIGFLKGNITSLWWASETYRGYAEKIDEDCAQAAKLLRDYLQLDQAAEKEKQLRHRLGLESGS
jgi:chromosome segregation ATPase